MITDLKLDMAEGGMTCSHPFWRISIPGLVSRHFGSKPYEEKVLNMF